jgi:hypothetical protein
MNVMASYIVHKSDNFPAFQRHLHVLTLHLMFKNLTIHPYRVVTYNAI